MIGRHGSFSCYEAFVHIVDSMVNQHAKWLKVSKHLAWRAPVASLNDLLNSHVDVLARVPGLADRPAGVKRAMEVKLAAHRAHICQYGDDPPGVRDWMWSGRTAVTG